MASRHGSRRGRRRCRNCPDEPTPEPVPPKTMTVVAEEGKKLWHQAIFGCNSVLEMMAGYAMLGVPGDPVPRLRKLVARLNEIIKVCETRGGRDADESVAAQCPSADDRGDAQ